MGLSNDQKQDAEQIAELTARRYFDTYMQDIFPQQVAAFIERHNGDRNAHGGAEVKINRLVWGIAGVSAVVGFLALVMRIVS